MCGDYSERENHQLRAEKVNLLGNLKTDHFDTLVEPNVRLLFAFDFEKLIRRSEGRIVRVLSVKR